MRKFIFIAVFCISVFFAGMFCQKFGALGKLRTLLTSHSRRPAIIDLANYEVDVFLLAGQSNMEGTGDSESYTAPPKHIADRIFEFDDGYILRRAREPIFKSGVGPSVAFAAEYLANKNDKNIAVVLVNSSRGGTNIQQWRPSEIDGELYAESVKRVLAASHLGQIEGVLFFQGESDAEGDDDDHPDDWDQCFYKIVSELRSDLRNLKLPVVFAQIGPGSKSDWLKVKEAQARVDLEFVSMIKTDDLSYEEGVHFKTSAYIEIGRRFGRAIVELQQ